MRDWLVFECSVVVGAMCTMRVTMRECTSKQLGERTKAVEAKLRHSYQPNRTTSLTTTNSTHEQMNVVSSSQMQTNAELFNSTPVRVESNNRLMRLSILVCHYAQTRSSRCSEWWSVSSLVRFTGGMRSAEW